MKHCGAKQLTKKGQNNTNLLILLIFLALMRRIERPTY
jgi:hypothetical protein